MPVKGPKKMGNIKAGDDIFFTFTMAEVLEKQGHYEDALMIYKILADTNPSDPTLNLKINRLKSLAERRRGIKPQGRENKPID